MTRSDVAARSFHVRIRMRCVASIALLLLSPLLGAESAGAQQTLPGPLEPTADEAIQPGDAVRLSVWRHEDLTGDFPVNQYGIVVIPKLGEIDVSGETHRSLRERVIRGLRETVVSPSIEVVVLKRIRVLGEVQRANVFLVDPTMTVADALAMAGGTTPQGRQGTVMLRREGVAVVDELGVDSRLSEVAIRSGDELVVPQRSWLDRNSSALIGAGAGLAGILVALLTR